MYSFSLNPNKYIPIRSESRIQSSLSSDWNFMRFYAKRPLSICVPPQRIWNLPGYHTNAGRINKISFTAGTSWFARVYLKRWLRIGFKIILRRKSRFRLVYWKKTQKYTPILLYLYIFSVRLFLLAD